MTLGRRYVRRQLQQIQACGQRHLGKAADLESGDAEQNSWREPLAEEFQAVPLPIFSSSKNKNGVCRAQRIWTAQPVIEARQRDQAFAQSGYSRTLLNCRPHPAYEHTGTVFEGHSQRCRYSTRFQLWISLSQTPHSRTSASSVCNGFLASRDLPDDAPGFNPGTVGDFSNMWDHAIK
jgi:hypothetical protein